MDTTFSPGSGTQDHRGRRAHPDTIAHSERLQRHFYPVGEHAWTLVGNGLSNQTFVRGPDGLIVIDTGESVEEMREALREIRAVCDAPIAACIYTHFHYVAGTTALLEDTSGREIPIYGHAGIEANLARTGGEVGPRGSRGMVHQFGIFLPDEGPDGLINVGLGRFFHNPDHSPFTSGHLPATETFDSTSVFTIAGLEVQIFPAPSDANDSITIWFPALDLAVNNLLWPALFNIFAIRGEEYRDPRVVLDGLEQLASLEARHLIGTHGPPLAGNETIRECIERYGDAIQYLWDQSVRGITRGLSADELTRFVTLPDVYNEHYTTRQFYGVAEHHVRQIYAGLFGWFDENEENLVPLAPTDRYRRLINGFGGPDAVRRQVDDAIAKGDYRWAIELSNWLVRAAADAVPASTGGAPEDRARLAAALRGVGYNTASANLRNWCLTRALELDGSLDLSRFRTHRYRAQEAAANPARTLETLRVLLDPVKAVGLHDAIRFDIDDVRATLVIRNGVAIPVPDGNAELGIRVTREDFGAWLAGKADYASLRASGRLVIEGESARIERLLSCFDIDLVGAGS